MTESPCSDMSTRSQSVTDKDNIMAISNSSVGAGPGAIGGASGAVGAIGAHGYNNEAYSSNRQHNICAPKPLKQLVVTTG